MDKISLIIYVGMALTPGIKEMMANLLNNDIVSLEKNYTEYFSKPIATKNFGGIEGLWYIQHYLSKEEIDLIKSKLDEEIDLEPISNKKYSRRVAHFGYYYSYDKTGLKSASVIPDYLGILASPDRINKILGVDLIKQEFDQVIINEYKPGQEIRYHTDHTKLFGPIVVCITVGHPVPINFRLGDVEKLINVAEASMYIMTDAARYQWQHSLKNRGKDNRYSITYRTALLKHM